MASSGPTTTAPGGTRTVLALKEWGAVAHALLDGRQTLLLRKGGIHERAFRLEGGASPFVLFPTVAHSHAERVRPEHRDLLGPGAADVGEHALTIRCAVEVVEAVEVARPEGLAEVEDLHVWTAASIAEDRLAFRPKHPLHALVVRALALPAPETVERLADYGGCRSWLELPLAWDGRSGRCVHEDARLASDVRRVRAAVGA